MNFEKINSGVRQIEVILFKAAGAADLGEDVGCLGGPDERLWIFVVRGDVLVDGCLQLGHAGEYAAPNTLVRDVAEEAFNHIEPGRTGRREVQRGCLSNQVRSG